MDGDGFASRIVIDENGRPSAEMIMDDGIVKRGDFDMVPALETFIAKHPDFSYRGARGILALTGYEGTLGYRTNNMDSPTYEQDKTAVKNVVKVLKEYGWEFASHSYGHRDMQKYSFKFLKKDTDRWLKEVGSLIGPTDIYVFPYGIDIETSMKNYSSNKYQYLKKSGFDYYCGVYKEPWIQINHDYVRMTRRPLDGQAMLQFPERLADLFNLKTIVDPSRPKLK
jgi:peptidoglycan/xylan/chitin deacetylase (PgdA/CDA1 family)